MSGRTLNVLRLTSALQYSSFFRPFLLPVVGPQSVPDFKAASSIFVRFRPRHPLLPACLPCVDFLIHDNAVVFCSSLCYLLQKVSQPSGMILCYCALLIVSLVIYSQRIPVFTRIYGETFGKTWMLMALHVANGVTAR